MLKIIAFLCAYAIFTCFGAFALSESLPDARWIKLASKATPSSSDTLVFRCGMPYFVQKSSPYLLRILIDKKRSIPEALPLNRVPLYIGATDQNGLYYVFQENGKLILFIEKNRQKLILPESVKSNVKTEMHISIGKKGNICLSDSKKIFFRDKSDWESVEIPSRYKYGLNKIVASPKRIYLAYSCGESGGRLLVFDKESRKFLTFLVGYNLYDICLDSRERLWIVCSTWDMFRIHGVLCKLENGKCTTVVENWGDCNRNGIVKLSPASTNWSFEPCTFDNIYADSKDDLYLGTCKHGIYKFSKRGVVKVSDSLWGSYSTTASCTNKILPVEGGFIFLIPDSGVYFQSGK